MENDGASKLMDMVPYKMIAQMVLQYLIDVSPKNVYFEFAKTSEYLKDEYEYLQHGFRPVKPCDLVVLIHELYESKQLVLQYLQRNNIEEGNTTHTTLPQLLKKLLVIQSAKKSRIKKRRFSKIRDSFFVLNNTTDVSDSECDAKKTRYESPTYVLNDGNELVPGKSEEQPPARPDTSSAIPEHIVERECSVETTGSLQESPVVPIKQRLRKTIKKREFYNPETDKKGNRKKINIISNEKVTLETTANIDPTGTMFPGNPNYIPTTGLFFIQSTSREHYGTQVMSEFHPMNQPIPSYVSYIPHTENVEQMIVPVVQEISIEPEEMKESTPKNSDMPILHIKSQSTPRRMASHVRTLNFNTPSGKLQTAAGPSIVAGDMSKTPHVRKNAKECARILSVASTAPPEVPIDDKKSEWQQMRESAKSQPWDQHLRLVERQKEDEQKLLKKNAKVTKKKKPSALDVDAQMLEDALRSAKKPSPVKEIKEEVKVHTPETNKIIDKVLNVIEPKEEQNTTKKTTEDETIVSIDAATEAADTVPEALNLFCQPQLPQTKSVEKILSLSSLLETPFKDEFLTQFPSTPRFLIPNSTPAIKAALSGLLDSEVKHPELTTPLFPITPGLKVTPDRDSPQIGPCNRPTDYSSSSSYYKPDESEDMDHKIDMRIKAEFRNRTESEKIAADVIAPQPVVYISKTPVKIDNPATLERIKSFTDTTDFHYNEVHAPILPEPEDTESSSDSSSSSASSFSCTSSSSSSYTSDEEKDKNYVSPEVQPDSSYKVNKCGEIRYPFRDWMIPVENVVVQPPEETAEEKYKDGDCPKKKIISEMEEKRLRIIGEMKEEQKAGTSKTGNTKARAPKRIAAKRNVRMTKAKLTPKKFATPKRKSTRFELNRQTHMSSAKKTSGEIVKKQAPKKPQVKKGKQEQERLEKERLEQERLEKERLEQERLQKERLEQDRLEKERLEQERLKKERLEKERLEQERLEKERLEQERREKERIDQERRKQERKDQEKREQERKDQERREQERIDQEKREQKKKDEQKRKQERRSQDRKYQERKSQEKGNLEKKSDKAGENEKKFLKKVQEKKDDLKCGTSSSLKGYTIPKKVQDPTKALYYRRSLYTSSSEDESSPQIKLPVEQNKKSSEDSSTRVSILSMLEDESLSDKTEGDNSKDNPDITLPTKKAARTDESPEIKEEGEISDSDDEFNRSIVTTDIVIAMEHDPTAKPRDFHHNDFNADAMLMNATIYNSTLQLSLCDAVNIFDVRPLKKNSTVRKKSPQKVSKTRSVQVPEAVASEGESSTKSAIKPKICVKYKTSETNAKNSTPSCKRLSSSSPGGIRWPKYTNNQLDKALQQIHGSERK